MSRSGERNPTVIVEPGDGRIPYQPTAAVKRDEFLASFQTPRRSWSILTPMPAHCWMVSLAPITTRLVNYRSCRFLATC